MLLFQADMLNAKAQVLLLKLNMLQEMKRLRLSWWFLLPSTIHSVAVKARILVQEKEVPNGKKIKIKKGGRMNRGE